MTLYASPDLPAACARHQDALIDFVDCGEAAPGVGPALAHLEQCEACTRDLAATALVLTALRRMFDEARAAEMPADSWPRLRARLDARAPRPWSPGKITGLVTGAALVTALLLPNAARLNTAGYATASLDSGRLESIRIPLPGDSGGDRLSMVVHLERANAVGSVQEDVPEPPVTYVAPYPDNIRPAPATTASIDVDPVPARWLHPV